MTATAKHTFLNAIGYFGGNDPMWDSTISVPGLVSQLVSDGTTFPSLRMSGPEFIVAAEKAVTQYYNDREWGRIRSLADVFYVILEVMEMEKEVAAEVEAEENMWKAKKDALEEKKVYATWADGTTSCCLEKDAWGAHLVFKSEDEFRRHIQEMDDLERRLEEEEATRRDNNIRHAFRHVALMDDATPNRPMGEGLYDLWCHVHDFKSINGDTYVSYLRGWRRDRFREAQEVAAWDAEAAAVEAAWEAARKAAAWDADAAVVVAWEKAVWDEVEMEAAWKVAATKTRNADATAAAALKAAAEAQEKAKELEDATRAAKLLAAKAKAKAKVKAKAKEKAKAAQAAAEEAWKASHVKVVATARLQK